MIKKEGHWIESPLLDSGNQVSSSLVFLGLGRLHLFMEEIVVLVTAGSETEATNIARALVEQGLVACVNVLPGVRSIFQWDGKVTEEREFLLIAKTVSQAFERVATAVKSLHSYSVPEVIALPIQHGLPEYLSWVRDVTKRAGQSA